MQPTSLACPFLFFLVGVCAQESSAFFQIFHGTSIVLYPNASSSWPGNSTFVAANFYCYFTSSGYLSFGWYAVGFSLLKLLAASIHLADNIHQYRWLPAVPGSNHSHCNPGSSAYDWYEITTSSSCGEHGCQAHVLNYDAADSSTPAFEEDYRLAALDLGNGQLGRLGLSYFNRKGGGYAVGTRSVISESAADAEDCRKALQTFRLLQKDKGLKLSFELSDLCTHGVLDQGIRQPLQENQQLLQDK
jgi:hypothetical protein